ncbi:MAG: hypothetical protein HPAVJP_3600 [Candidatus Hepatoplasma vulgare]|nr:MAG: hypothetical protein HPAVJP_3600 [Candidatus Hepatoplasma sp.]
MLNIIIITVHLLNNIILSEISNTSTNISLNTKYIGTNNKNRPKISIKFLKQNVFFK